MLLVLVSELDNVPVTGALYVVGFYVRLEHGEAVAHIGGVVEVHHVDTRDFYFVTWCGTVNQIISNVDFFLAGDTTRRYAARSLLHGKLLIVPVYRRVLIESVRTLSSAANALSKELTSLILGAVEHGSLDIATSAAEVHLLELRFHTCALRDNAFELDQRVQVHLAQVTQLVLDRQISDSYEDLSLIHI